LARQASSQIRPSGSETRLYAYMLAGGHPGQHVTVNVARTVPWQRCERYRTVTDTIYLSQCYSDRLARVLLHLPLENCHKVAWSRLCIYYAEIWLHM